MNKMTIRGAEYPIKKIFSDDFVFTIPLYQRAYSWTTEQSEELLQDLLRAMEGGEESIDDLSPYFLGSIVLIKGDDPEAQVIDGQQRLTTLTMLLAALRSMIKSEYVEGLTSFLCEKGNVITGTPTRYRLRLRDRDAKFFQQYIQDEDGIEALKTLSNTTLPESQRNIRDNALDFIIELQKLSQDQLVTLTQFIVNRCFLVVVAVSSADLDSAYRVFSVLNSRGLELSYPDILKAEIISSIPSSQQDDYATKWEELESMLGSEEFAGLFHDLRTIFARQRQRKGLIEEFKVHVFPQSPSFSTPQEFIDKTLVPYANALNNILKMNYQHGLQHKEINTMFRWLNQLDHQRWIPVALSYFIEYWSAPEQVIRFLKDLERLAISFMICRLPPYKRHDRYYRILEAIHQKEDMFNLQSPIQLTTSESQNMLRMLGGDVYYMPHVCRYLLLRLDARLSEGVASYDYQTITVEHVLPQRPAPDSEWVRTFPTKELRERYVHRLGNLVLLSRGKNMKAENLDFEIKKRRYFMSDGGISPFVLTTQVLQKREWTPEVIEGRQKQLIGMLKQLWRL